MEEEILNYVKNKNNISYHELPMIFGLELNDILIILNLTHRYENDTLIIQNKEKQDIYSHKGENETWGFYENKKLVRNSNNKGYWENFMYDIYGRFCGIENSDQIKSWSYDRFGGKIDETIIKK